MRRDLQPAPGAAEHGDDDKDHRQRHGVGAAQPAQQLGGAGDLGAHRIRRQGAAGDVLNLAEQQAPTAFGGRTDVLRQTQHHRALDNGVVEDQPGAQYHQRRDRAPQCRPHRVVEGQRLKVAYSPQRPRLGQGFLPAYVVGRRHHGDQQQQQVACLHANNSEWMIFSRKPEV